MRFHPRSSITILALVLIVYGQNCSRVDFSLVPATAPADKSVAPHGIDNLPPSDESNETVVAGHDLPASDTPPAASSSDDPPQSPPAPSSGDQVQGPPAPSAPSDDQVQDPPVSPSSDQAQVPPPVSPEAPSPSGDQQQPPPSSEQAQVLPPENTDLPIPVEPPSEPRQCMDIKNVSIEDLPRVACGSEGNISCVQLCHVPKGNADNAHTIVVGMRAVAAHLNHHDDTLGACGAPVVEGCQ